MYIVSLQTFNVHVEACAELYTQRCIIGLDAVR